jgi:hypothetical protein
MYKDMLWRNHVLFSVFKAPQDALLHLGVPERVMGLAAILFTSMCVSALVCGRRPDAVQSRVVTGMIAAACMVPCRLVIPKLYRSATQLPVWLLSRRVAASQSRGGGGTAAGPRRQNRRRAPAQALCCCRKKRSESRLSEASTAVMPLSAAANVEGGRDSQVDGRPHASVVHGTVLARPPSAGAASTAVAAPTERYRGVKALIQDVTEDNDLGSESFRELPLGAGSLRSGPTSPGERSRKGDGGKVNAVRAVVAVPPRLVESAVADVTHLDGVSTHEAPFDDITSGGHRASLNSVDVKLRSVDADAMAHSGWLLSHRRPYSLFLTDAERVVVASSLDVTDVVESVDVRDDASALFPRSGVDRAGSVSATESTASRPSGSLQATAVAVQRCVVSPSPKAVFVALLNAQFLVRVFAANMSQECAIVCVDVDDRGRVRCCA